MALFICALCGFYVMNSGTITEMGISRLALNAHRKEKLTQDNCLGPLPSFPFPLFLQSGILCSQGHWTYGASCHGQDTCLDQGPEMFPRPLSWSSLGHSHCLCGSVLSSTQHFVCSSASALQSSASDLLPAPKPAPHTGRNHVSQLARIFPDSSGLFSLLIEYFISFF